MSSGQGYCHGSKTFVCVCCLLSIEKHSCNYHHHRRHHHHHHQLREAVSCLHSSTGGLLCLDDMTRGTKRTVKNYKSRTWTIEIKPRRTHFTDSADAYKTASYQYCSSDLSNIYVSQAGEVSCSDAAGLRNRNTCRHSAVLLTWLQSVMNSAARLVLFSSSWYDHITPLLRQLQWLKARDRCPCLQVSARSSVVVSCRPTCSTDGPRGRLHVVTFRRITIADCLPYSIRDCHSLPGCDKK